MNKILLALTILGTGAGGLMAARQSTTWLRQEVNAAREAWLVQTQKVERSQSNRATLVEHIRQLKETLTRTPAVSEDPLWTALQTNRIGHLTPELRESLLNELGFDWRSSADFVVVSKETVRELRFETIRDGKLTDVAATVLALSPSERDQVDAAVQRVRADYADWALNHVQRHEPKEDVVAHYSLPNGPVMVLTNSFGSTVSSVLGRDRAELLLDSAWTWMRNTGLLNEGPTALIVKLSQTDGDHTLRFQTQLGALTSWDLRQGSRFPKAFRPIFPKGWADVAEREGFELSR